MANVNSSRPGSLLVAAAGGLVLGLVEIGLAVASLVSGHGNFSGVIGGWLAVYGLVTVAAAVALWRLSVFGRGPLLTIAALNLAVAVASVGESAWAWPIAICAAVTLVAVCLPGTSHALRAARVRPADAPPPSPEPKS